MKWLKNYERVQELQQQIIWQPITELDPRAFIPEVVALIIDLPEILLNCYWEFMRIPKD